jgi:hypothetical protein
MIADTAIWLAFTARMGWRRAAGHNDFKIIMSEILFHLDFWVFSQVSLVRSVRKFCTFGNNPMEQPTSARHRVSEASRRTAQSPDDAQRRALARLYARRSAVSNLISALERYQREQRLQRAKGGVPTDGEMSS